MAVGFASGMSVSSGSQLPDHPVMASSSYGIFQCSTFLSETWSDQMEGVASEMAREHKNLRDTKVCIFG